MMDFLHRLMDRRYGLDALSIALLALWLVVSLIGNFTNLLPVTLLAFVPLAFAALRIFSRDTTKRARENGAFLTLTRPAYESGRRVYRQVTDRSNIYFKCPACRQTLRVPRGRGMLAVTCPKCGGKSVKKT